MEILSRMPVADVDPNKKAGEGARTLDVQLGKLAFYR